MQVVDQGQRPAVDAVDLGLPPVQLPLDVAGVATEITQADRVHVDRVQGGLHRDERLGRGRPDSGSRVAPSASVRRIVPSENSMTKNGAPVTAVSSQRASGRGTGTPPSASDSASRMRHSRSTSWARSRAFGPPGVAAAPTVRPRRRSPGTSGSTHRLRSARTKGGSPSRWSVSHAAVRADRGRDSFGHHPTLRRPARTGVGHGGRARFAGTWPRRQLRPARRSRCVGPATRRSRN